METHRYLLKVSWTTPNWKGHGLDEVRRVGQEGEL